jgi:hypothetical protein
MPELTKEHLEILGIDKEVEAIIKKKKLLKNDDTYVKIRDGVTGAYNDAEEDIPADVLTFVVEVVSSSLLPENKRNLKDYYYGRTQFTYLKGGGRRKRKSKKRKSKKRKSKKRKSRTRRRRR